MDKLSFLEVIAAIAVFVSLLLGKNGQIEHLDSE